MCKSPKWAGLRTSLGSAPKRGLLAQINMTSPTGTHGYGTPNEHGEYHRLYLYRAVVLSGLLCIVLTTLPGCSTAKPFPSRPFAPSVPETTFRLAALLPLSGPFSRYGKESLQGIELAIEEAKQARHVPFVDLIIKDTAVEQREIGETLEQTVRESSPLAVIGPLFSMEIEHVARLSKQLKLPVITPSATLPNVRAASPYIFSTALTFPAQAQAVARYALRTGYRRMCIIAPESGYGRKLGRFLAEEVQHRGGDIVSEQWYAKGERDFSALIKQLKAADVKKYGTMKTERRRGRTTKVYTPGFDAIFIPGDYREVVLIATQLQFYGIHVPLLGSNAWKTNDLDHYPDRSLAGAVFVDSFFDSARLTGHAHDFAKQYKIQYGIEPSMFVVHSYEATKILLQALHEGAKSGKEIRQYLETGSRLYALAGPTSFNSQGVLDRQMYFVQMNQTGHPVLLQ